MTDTLQSNALASTKTDIDRLWQAYAQDPSEATTAALLEQYLPVVHGIIRNLHIYPRADLDREDFLQVAMMGLLEAIPRYDQSRGVSFRSFAARRVRGAVLDLLRKFDTLSRKEREEWQGVQSHLRDYVNTNAYMPDEETLAKKAGISLSKLQDLSLRAQSTLSLDMVYQTDSDGDGVSLADRLIDEAAKNPGGEAAQQELRTHFRSAFRMLPDREQKILYLYYYEELTLKEIGEVMELTEARICQLHAKSLLSLRALIPSAA